METKQYYIHKVSSHCAWAGDHQSATETFITNSPNSEFVSVDDDISVEAQTAVLVDAADVSALLKHIEYLDGSEGDVYEINGLDIEDKENFVAW